MAAGDTRTKVRSFVLGGVVGASAVIAAGRRAQQRSRKTAPSPGLAAFESAPCFDEPTDAPPPAR